MPVPTRDSTPDFVAGTTRGPTGTHDRIGETQPALFPDRKEFMPAIWQPGDPANSVTYSLRNRREAGDMRHWSARKTAEVGSPPPWGMPLGLTALARLAAFLAAAARAWRQRYLERKTIETLRALDDPVLKDIGVRRGEIVSTIRGLAERRRT